MQAVQPKLSPYFGRKTTPEEYAQICSVLDGQLGQEEFGRLNPGLAFAYDYRSEDDSNVRRIQSKKAETYKDGLALARFLKNQQSLLTDEQPLIFLTHYLSPQDAQQEMDTGKGVLFFYKMINLILAPFGYSSDKIRKAIQDTPDTDTERLATLGVKLINTLALKISLSDKIRIGDKSVLVRLKLPANK